MEYVTKTGIKQVFMKYSGTETGDETENVVLRFCPFLNSWC